MSRSGYSDSCEGWELIRWRGAVASAIRGKRGQAFLKEMLAALDGLPEKRLIAHELIQDGEVCALGSVGKVRGMEMSNLDPEDTYGVADAFGIPRALVCEVEYINDEEWQWSDSQRSRMTPEQRFQMVRSWLVKQIREESHA